MAVYERGAISSGSSGTFTVRGAIFDKWLTVKDQTGRLKLGCPTAAARVAFENARAQDFEHGRIYAGLPTGAHYVPPVFVQAIDRQGHEAATGMPTADPSDSPGVMQTWLFQQFARPTGGLPSTLEIRGTPPRLFMERQGGDGIVLSQLGLSINPETSPTIWQDFGCSGNFGPCTVPPTPPAFTSVQRITNAKRQFCGGAKYPVTSWEWKAILGDNVLTRVLGIVKDSHKAGQDNPLVHDHSDEPCPDKSDFFNPLEPVLELAEGVGHGAFCPSDWNIHVRPLEHGSVSPYPSLFAGNTETLEIEFEEYYARHFFTNTVITRPRPGDLLFASGRWIIDCGHINAATDDMNSEIHPPAILAFMRTASYAGRPATMANIWVNGYYPGALVEFDIFPPPRPSADATLVVADGIDNHRLNVSVQHSFVPALTPNRVRVRVSAPPRTNAVSFMGKVEWEPGRSYESQ